MPVVDDKRKVTMKNRQKSRSGCRTCKLRRVCVFHSSNFHDNDFRCVPSRWMLVPIRETPVPPDPIIPTNIMFRSKTHQIITCRMK